MTVNPRGPNSSKSSRGVYKIVPSLLNPTSPAPASHSAPQSPSSHAALHRLHSPPHRTAAPHRIVPARHSPPCRAGTPLPTVSRRRSPLHRTHTPHRAAPPLHRLHSPTSPIHHGRFWRIHQRQSSTLWLCSR
jgi:hypothetical protein